MSDLAVALTLTAMRLLAVTPMMKDPVGELEIFTPTIMRARASLLKINFFPQLSR
jgi:hypothetical protein